jgi:hypothetical protein
VTVCDCCDPMVTLGNVSLVGFRVSCPGDAEVVPVPVNGRIIELLEALLVNEMLPLKFPAAAGAKLMLTVALCPAANVRGRLGETSEKEFEEIVAAVTVRDAPPVFEALTIKVLLLPAATLPKLTDELARLSVPC